MDVIAVGVPTLQTFTFKGNPVFPDAPQFEVITENDVILTSGDCTLSSTPNSWDVSFTIPTTYVVDNGSEKITVEVYGKDATNKIRSIEKNFTLIDTDEEFVPIGILVREGYNFTDSIILPKATYTSEVEYELVDATGNVLIPSMSVLPDTIKRLASRDGMPERLSDKDFAAYKYTYTIDASGIVYPALTYGPHFLNYTVIEGGKIVKYESHPVYRISHLWSKHLISIRRYLDQARLVEIDPTLQWKDDELCQSLLDGAAYINNYPNTLTYWVVENFPESLHQTLVIAACYHALNARYLAEGLTNFEFNGLSSTLNVDRRDTLVYKLEELKAFLEANLKAIKAMAIEQNGGGVSSTGQTATTSGKALGVLGLTNTPASNIHAPFYQTRYGLNYRRT